MPFSCSGKKRAKRSRHRGGVLTRAPAPVNTLPCVPHPWRIAGGAARGGKIAGWRAANGRPYDAGRRCDRECRGALCAPVSGDQRSPLRQRTRVRRWMEGCGRMISAPTKWGGKCLDRIRRGRYYLPARQGVRIRRDPMRKGKMYRSGRIISAPTRGRGAEVNAVGGCILAWFW